MLRKYRDILHHIEISCIYCVNRRRRKNGIAHGWCQGLLQCLCFGCLLDLLMRYDQEGGPLMATSSKYCNEWTLDTVHPYIMLVPPSSSLTTPLFHVWACGSEGGAEDDQKFWCGRGEGEGGQGVQDRWGEVEDGDGEAQDLTIAMETSNSSWPSSYGRGRRDGRYCQIKVKCEWLMK